MTVRELKEVLEDFNDDAEVRIAEQPSYPLQSTIRGCCTDREARERDEEEYGEGNEPGGSDDIVFIVEGSQVYDTPYAPRGAFDAAYY